jgi:hypothetical protein
MAGALGVAGAAFQVLPASAAEASRALRSGAAADSARAATAAPEATGAAIQPFAGADRSAFEQMLTGSDGTPLISPPPTAVRWYMDAKTYPNMTGGYAALGWPDITTMYNSPAHALVSIRPDIESLIARVFDADLHAFMLQAPAGPASLLTIWHECATFNLTKPEYPQDPELFVEALSHLQALAAGQVQGYSEPTNVKVGVVDVNPSALPLKKYSFKPTTAQDVYNVWMAANLDWYGCDLYDNADYNLSAYDELNQFRTCVNSLPESFPNSDWPINIPEINSPVTDDGSGRSTIPTLDSPTGWRRSDFFHYAWRWLETIGPASHCSGLLGFWNGSGNEGSDWPPYDWPQGSQAAMVTELETETGQSAP